jgi:ClpP class serine protease
MSNHLYNLALTIPWQITPDALEAMLSLAIDEPLPEEEFKRRMHGPRSLALRDGKRRDDRGTILMRDNVAILSVDGPIYRYADYFTQVSGGVTTEQLGRDVQTALDDSAVGAILFVVDSPGGEVTGIGELSNVIYNARGVKPIGAYIEGYGTSAAFRIGGAADVVIVDAEAIVGSIGTIMGVADPTKRPSYRIDIVSTQSPKKRPDVTTPEGRAILQATVDRLTDVFIAETARNRNISVEAILAIAGGVLVGQDAIDAGLADRLGSEEGAIRDLAQRAARRKLFPVRLPNGVPITAQEEGMKVSQFIAGIFKGAEDAGIELEPDVAAEAPAQTTRAESATAAANTEPTPEQAAQSARLAELEKKLAEQREQAIASQAAAFAVRAVRERRAYPAEHASLIALYVQAAQDDDRAPMSEAQKSRIAQIEASIAARPQHSLSAELIASSSGGVLETGGTGPMSEERRRSLLQVTPLGQAAISRRAKSA